MDSKTYPFTHDPAQQISGLGECILLEHICNWLGDTTPIAPAGIGDDCAVMELDATQKTCITTDAISYGQHFDATVTPFEAGVKLIHRNLSDLAAMGAQPQSAVLTLLSGPDLALAWLKAFFKGVRSACVAHTLKIVGGDLSTLPAGQFSASLTLLGSCKRPLLRQNASIGDWLYTTGTLGGSILGKHFRFDPRLAEGQWFAAQDACRAMMDLTDGLGKDLQVLLPNDSSAAIDLNSIPIDEAAQAFGLQTGKPALQHAFCDGEDYELLLAVAADADCGRFETCWQAEFPNLRLSRIGQIISKHPAGVFIEKESGASIPWTYGYEHWKRDV
ncbi:MAG: Thiamine-monophosphate kinase [Opitutia bacterium UBA7350]|nr:MAG: Thiamine-monophosphate kinase [Opitutae bacterium UBA7350]